MRESVPSFVWLVLATIVCSLLGCDAWRAPTSPRAPLQSEATSVEALAREGAALLFGSAADGLPRRTSGAAQCPVCHVFQAGNPATRAPNLWGITARQRTALSSLAYLAESHVCPDCYVTAGWGAHGTQGCRSPMPKAHLPPVNLTLRELIAIDTWLYVHDGDPPPSPRTIREAYRNVLSVEEWGYVTREETASDSLRPVAHSFYRHACATCHRIPGIAGATGALGPPLWMGDIPMVRLRDPEYRGEAETAKEYLEESIMEHDRYVAPEHAMYAAQTLPTGHYRGVIDRQELARMVEYLAQTEPLSEVETAAVVDAESPIEDCEPGR